MEPTHWKNVRASAITIDASQSTKLARPENASGLTDPHVHTSPDDHFSEDPRNLVPTVDPFGEEYLRTSNVCDRFHPSEEAQAHEGAHGWWHAHL